MRTTLTIDDDLAGILKRRAGEMDKPFKDIVNTALRQGLTEHLTTSPHPTVVRPHDFGAMLGGLDADRMNQLVDELEVEEFLQKAARDDPSRH